MAGNVKRYQMKLNEVFRIEAISKSAHFFGTDSDDNQCIILKVDYKKKPANIKKRDILQVDFITSLHVAIDQKEFKDKFCIIRCLNKNFLMSEYFKVFGEKTANDYPDRIKSNEIIKRLDIVHELFNVSKNNSNNEIGLWGELVCIYASEDPEFMLKCWHSEKEQTWDFVDGKRILEVKTYTGSERKHKFNFKQLNSEVCKTMIVASVYTLIHDNGLTIFDLKNMIKERLKDINLIEKLNRIFIDTIGNSFSFEEARKFSLEQSLSHSLLVSGALVPKIHNSSVIDEGVSGISFTSLIEHLPPIENSENKFSKIF